ncbi:MAG: hypothetical protein AAB849_01070 [Patescibacteria group bacterium]
MLEYLFGSKTRLKLLRLFFNQPEQKFFVRELTRLVNTQINSVRRELVHLLNAQIIIPGEADEPAAEKKDKKKMDGKRKYYCLNPRGVINSELRALLLKAQFWGEKQLIETVKKIGHIDFLVLAGRFVGLPEAPTDLLIVGNLAKKDLSKLIRVFEDDFGGEVRYTVMTPKEFLYRRDVADKFLSAIFENKHLVAVDNLPTPYSLEK